MCPIHRLNDGTEPPLLRGWRRVMLLLFGGVLGVGCGVVLATAQLHFTPATRSAGIHFQHADGRSGQKYFLETLGAGAAWLDYEKDGDLDVYFVNGADLPGHRSATPPTNALYRNNGDGTFTDVTAHAGVGDKGYGFSACVGDYDNDGWPDLYVVNFGSNVLYRNRGDGRFTDVTSGAGVGDERWGAAAAFGDYDNDGDIDLFVSNYVAYQLAHNPLCEMSGIRLYCSPEVFDGVPSVLYRNNGDGTFTDVTQAAGVFHPNDKGMGVIWCDYDNDGDLDLFVANDKMADRLYQNRGDGTFEDVAFLSGVALGELGAARSSMAPIFGDYDNDGWLDLVVTTYQDEPNGVSHNAAGRFFSDVTFPSGVGLPSLSYLSWGADFADFDNDGNLDLFVANGHIDDNIHQVKPDATYAQANQLFINRGDGSFADVSNQSGEGLRFRKVSRGAALADYDNDGDVDILVTNANGPPDLLRNETVNPNGWLCFTTVGVQSNRDGIGARIKIVAGGRQQLREVKSGGSYPSQSDMRLHFGLGEADVADRVEIRWPSGQIDRFFGVKRNQFLKATEGQGLSPVRQEGTVP